MPAGKHGNDPETSFYLPVNASEGIITLYHSISNACTGWTGTRNTGRSQRSNAKPFSPEQRNKYSLYDNKASLGAEAAEGLQQLEEKLTVIGYRISKERGDYFN